MNATPLPASPSLWPRIGGTPDSASSRRLWRALAHPAKRPAALQGADAFGDALRGWIENRRASLLDWKRADAVITLARTFEGHSSTAFSDHAESAREAVITGRDTPEAVDLALATAYEAVRRVTGLRLHREQVMGALVMTRGCCAELATGEGKTLTAVLAATPDAWVGRGLHVVTVNDYLARRDAEITGDAYRVLGITVGCVQETSTQPQRRAAYAKDVTYAADKQVIFDYLRDTLAAPLRARLTPLLLGDLTSETDGEEACAWTRRVVQRGHHAAIVDEADSVLIDDAVTPAIISGRPEDDESVEHYRIAARIADRLKADHDYKPDPETKRVSLTDRGRASLVEWAGELPPFWRGPRRREELLTLALAAKEHYLRGRDYIVRDGTVQIVDRSTGRVLPGRQWQLGVHQSVEAKEGVPVTREAAATARVSYQSYFRRYPRLSGMSGTCREVADELWKWYRLPVARVPTHRPVARVHEPDRFLMTEEEKLRAVVERVERESTAGRPVLVGAWSIRSSEVLGAMLRARGLSPSVLNADREAEEAQIIARAGEPGAVTVATNMAGRGTDIRIGEEARRTGGLLVIATERHDESRVDRQLFGRSGRQGDPGGAAAYVCLEDNLVKNHGLAPLVWLVRRAAGPWRRLALKLLWVQAQRSASAKWKVARRETAKADSWMSMAMHRLAR